MPKAIIVISAYPLIAVNDHGFTVEMGLGKDHPSRRFEISSVADCKTALQLFATEIEATNKPWRLSTSFPRQKARKPNGFDKAQNARELDRNVNPHLVSS